MQMPKPPDPDATAAAQGNMNVSTAVANQFLNHTDQNTPDGSLKYSQTGTNVWKGPDGKTYRIPKFTANQTLTGMGQKIYNTQNEAKLNLAGLMKNQSARLGGLLDRPLSLGNEATEARLFGLGSKRLDPKFAADEESLRTRLSNQGLGAGSAAWNAEMGKFGQGKNDAYNQLLLQGRSQATQEQLAERNQPLNEIIGLMNGSQINQPQFASTPQSQIAGVDYAGLVNQDYQARSQQAQAKMGGLFGLLGSGLGLFSDRRLKTNIQSVGELANGLNRYVFDYIDGLKGQVGVMADEVRGLIPGAVTVDPSGYDRVDYMMVGV